MNRLHGIVAHLNYLTGWKQPLFAFAYRLNFASNNCFFKKWRNLRESFTFWTDLTEKNAVHFDVYGEQDDNSCEHHDRWGKPQHVTSVLSSNVTHIKISSKDGEKYLKNILKSVDLFFRRIPRDLDGHKYGEVVHVTVPFENVSFPAVEMDFKYCYCTRAKAFDPKKEKKNFHRMSPKKKTLFPLLCDCMKVKGDKDIDQGDTLPEPIQGAVNGSRSNTAVDPSTTNDGRDVLPASGEDVVANGSKNNADVDPSTTNNIKDPLPAPDEDLGATNNVEDTLPALDEDLGAINNGENRSPAPKQGAGNGRTSNAAVVDPNTKHNGENAFQTHTSTKKKTLFPAKFPFPCDCTKVNEDENSNGGDTSPAQTQGAANASTKKLMARRIFINTWNIK